MIALGSRDTHGALESPADPVDAVLRIPHPALLIGGSLAFLAVASGLSVAHQVRATDAWPPGTLATLLAGCVAVLAALVLLAIRPAQTMHATLVGLLLLDVIPVVLQFGSLDPGGGRARVLFLVIPTVLAASSLAALAHRSHLAVVVLLAAVMVGIPGTDRSPLDRIFEAVAAAGVLLAADLLVRRLSSATAERIFQLRTLSLTDGLTGVLNRRGFAAGFDGLVRGARRDSSLGLLIADIDHFKWFNDEYGHAAGDEILRRVCQVLAATAGPGNLVARIGGEELAALVVGRAEPVAQAFRAALEDLQPRVTVSVGIIDVTHDDCTAPGALWQILDAADRALYEAKNTGRNRICRATLDEATAPVGEPPAPAPHPAAVPLQGIVGALPPARLPIWTLAAFGLAGLVTVFGSERAVFSPLDWIFLMASTACVIAAVVLTGVQPRHRHLRLLGGVFGADLVITLGVLDLGDPGAKLTGLLPLLLTGLMVAQYSSRVAVLAHHVVVGVVSVLALGGTLTVPAVVGVVFHGGVLIGSAELIYWLRRRHDMAAEDLHRWSVTDPLTGLANRRGLELAYARMPRTRNVTILALDVDDFKAVNDRHGHAVGDDALIRLANTLRAVTGSGTVVGRTGGDEFVLLAPASHAGTLTSKVSRAAGLLPVPLSVSIGSTVVAPYHRLSLWQLVAAADAGLTRAKRARRQANRVDDFDPEDTVRQTDGGAADVPITVMRVLDGGALHKPAGAAAARADEDEHSGTDG